MINEFISQVKTRGLARTNRYEVQLTFPSQNTTAMKLADLFCDSVNLPGINIATTPSTTIGESREMPYNRMFEPVQLSFYVDSGLELKTQFDSWMENIINPNTRSIGYYRDYTTPVHIYVKSVDGQSPYMVTLHEAYPKTINSIQLDTSSRDIMKMSVTLQYKFWTYISIPLQTSSAQTSQPTRTNLINLGKKIGSNLFNVGGSGTASQDPVQANTGAGYPENTEFSEFSTSNFRAYDTFDPSNSIPVSRALDSIQSIRDATFRAQLLAQSDVTNQSEFGFTGFTGGPT